MVLKEQRLRRNKEIKRLYTTTDIPVVDLAEQCKVSRQYINTMAKKEGWVKKRDIKFRLSESIKRNAQSLVREDVKNILIDSPDAKEAIVREELENIKMAEEIKQKSYEDWSIIREKIKSILDDLILDKKDITKTGNFLVRAGEFYLKTLQGVGVLGGNTHLTQINQKFDSTDKHKELSDKELEKELVNRGLNNII